MISITRINDKEMIINCDLIESIESTPDTMISMTTGKKIMVKETVEEITDRVIQYKQKIFR